MSSSSAEPEEVNALDAGFPASPGEVVSPTGSSSDANSDANSDAISGDVSSASSSGIGSSPSDDLSDLSGLSSAAVSPASDDLSSLSDYSSLAVSHVAPEAPASSPVADVGSPNAVVSPDAVSPDAVSPVGPTEQITAALLILNPNLSEPSVRETVENGLRAWNSIPNVCQPMVDAIKTHTDSNPDSIKFHFNPEIGLLSDFVQHCKMLISVNGLQPDASEAIVAEVEKTFADFIKTVQGKAFSLTVDKGAFIAPFGTQISLVLRIEEVFNVPVFTAYVMRDIFAFDSRESHETVGPPFTHNAKLITNYSRLDVLLELLLHAATPDPYDAVNVLIACGMRALIVSKFASESPNAVIKTECDKFIALTANDTVTPMIIKSVLIAVMQDPSVKTVQGGEHFSDIFPSGQYGKYFEEVAYRATTVPVDQGPIVLNEPTSTYLTRTDIIIAAMTAMNEAMRASDAHMVISGGAAVSFYIQEFLKNLESESESFQGFAGQLDIDMAKLRHDCGNIKMNDIDCVVFGDVSRQFLLVFSLYMMILYDNFFARPKRYGVIKKDAPPISFELSTSASDVIDLYMYGDRDDDANTKLISKRLRKDPKVQLVTQKTKYFSQIVHPLCESSESQCKIDDYYLEPIDLVKKTIEHFTNLYMRSLYPKLPKRANQTEEEYATQEEEYAKQTELIGTMLKEHYYRDNLVSLKIIMLDIICIFCDEGASLFCRIFMARKNPKDFARLRVFIDIYLLQLLRSNSSFAEDNAEFIVDVRQLRNIMAQLNTTYYLEQGNIAVFRDDMAEQLNARRDEFLGVLRKVGRKIVELNAPTEPVPMQFRMTTGENTIQVFRDSPQIKYKFDMRQHMTQLFVVYVSPVPRTYDEWLNGVFKTILFAPKVELVFREKLATILGKEPESNYEIDFKDMPVRSRSMLQLTHLLNGIKIDDAKSKKIKKVRDLRYSLLSPLREFIAKPEQGRIAPSATHVIKIYHKPTINQYMVTLVRYLLKDELQNASSGLMEIVNDPANYDDAVREEIGRILLEWNQHAPPKLGGGSTRKRKLVCRLNARTRSKTRLTNAKKSRKKRNAKKLRFNRSSRA